MQRKQLTGHASKRVYDWQSGMAHWGETQRYGRRQSKPIPSGTPNRIAKASAQASPGPIHY